MPTIILTSSKTPMIASSVEMTHTLGKCQRFLSELSPINDIYRTVELMGAYTPVAGPPTAIAVVSYAKQGNKEVWRIRHSGGPVKRCVTVDKTSPRYDEAKAKAQVEEFFGLVDTFFNTGKILQ